ncbi:MAG: LPXTG cell wall anchor domain-containing protein [Anaerolineales bacterium]|nr:LPXTG cell wall anchor domain-containing protein [Anaerolineales bacterium]
MEPGEAAPVSNENQPNPPAGPSNRLFFIIASVIAGVMLLTIAGMIIFATVILPRQRSSEATQVAFIDMQNTEAALSAEQTIQALMWTATSTITPIPDTETPTPIPTLTFTPVVVSEEETEELPTIDPLTATAEAVLTEATQIPTATWTAATVTAEPLTPTYTPPVSTPTLTPPVSTHTHTPLVSTPTLTPQPIIPTPTSTPSELPKTGSSELSDLPMIALLIIGLVVVIIFARKLRLS